MMRREFLDAVEACRPNVHAANLAKLGRTVAGWNAVSAWYRATRADTVATGPDRHRRFVAWLLADLNRLRAVDKLARRIHRETVRRNRRRSERRLALHRELTELDLAMEPTGYVR